MDKNQAQPCLKELGTTRPEEIFFSVNYLCLSFGNSIIIHHSVVLLCLAIAQPMSLKVPEWLCSWRELPDILRALSHPNLFTPLFLNSLFSRSVHSLLGGSMWQMTVPLTGPSCPICTFRTCSWTTLTQDFSEAKEVLYEAFKKNRTIAWDNSVTFTLSKQTDAKQRTTARCRISRLGDSPIAGAVFKLHSLTWSEACEAWMYFK